MILSEFTSAFGTELMCQSWSMRLRKRRRHAGFLRLCDPLNWAELWKLFPPQALLRAPLPQKNSGSHIVFIFWKNWSLAKTQDLLWVYFPLFRWVPKWLIKPWTNPNSRRDFLLKLTSGRATWATLGMGSPLQVTLSSGVNRRFQVTADSGWFYF